MEDSTPAQELRAAVAAGTVIAPGAPTALVARLAERMEFQAIYLSGAAFSASVLAVPDIGLFTLTELVTQASQLTRASSVPLIVDADTGFGDVVNIERTVVELESVGVAAIQLEDQQLPKRCGHLSGKTLVGVDEMSRKIAMAVESRVDPDLTIIARTDARAGDGFDAAVSRARAYVDAGADWIFPEALQTYDEFKQFAAAVDVPLVANMTEFGKSPLLTRDELTELGYKVILYPVTLLRVAMKAMEAALQVLQRDGSQHELLDMMQTREQLYDLLEYADFEERDRQFFNSGSGGMDGDGGQDGDAPN